MAIATNLLIGLISWRLENQEHLWGSEPETHSPVQLRLTGNIETEELELRVESRNDKPVMVFVDPKFWFDSNSLRIRGHVPRKGLRTDPEETWYARPLAGNLREPAPWRAEVVTVDGNETIWVIEPATLEAVLGRVYKGQWTAEDDLPDDFWSTGAWKHVEVESTLIIRGSGTTKLFLDNWDLTHFRRWELALEGKVRNKRARVEALVRLTPSNLTEAARSLGG